MTTSEQERWDARYLESDRLWTGRPNEALVRHVEGLKPGTALDLGCGEGGDAIWLAQHGWHVTAVDISPVALQRAQKHAQEAGVDDHIAWLHVDLSEDFPEGRYDLVSAQFLHSESGLPREQVLRGAKEAVREGGILLIEGHGSRLTHHEHAPIDLPTPEQVVDALDLTPGEREVLTCEEHEVLHTRNDGEQIVRRDNTVKVRRLATPTV